MWCLVGFFKASWKSGFSFIAGFVLPVRFGFSYDFNQFGHWGS